MSSFSLCIWYCWGILGIGSINNNDDTEIHVDTTFTENKEKRKKLNNKIACWYYYWRGMFEYRQAFKSQNKINSSWEKSRHFVTQPWFPREMKSDVNTQTPGIDKSTV